MSALTEHENELADEWVAAQIARSPALTAEQRGDIQLLFAPVKEQIAAERIAERVSRRRRPRKKIKKGDQP